jgi:hypothetical protein
MSLQSAPAPGKTTKGADVAKTPANGTDTLKTHKLEA